MSTTTAKSFMPTKDEALSSVKDLGGLAGGMIAAHAIVTMTKKDTPIVNGGIAIVGLVAAMKVKSPLVKMIALGASAYGSIKLLNNLTKEVTNSESTAGLSGILPESAKAMIRKFMPTLSGMDELAGELSASDELDGLILDDFSMRGEEEERAMEGLSGSTLDLLG